MTTDPTPASQSPRAIRLPQARMLDDGKRLHLCDGPIDLIIEAFGPRDAVVAAHRAALNRMVGLLDELCEELPALRQGVVPGDIRLRGAVARRMAEAVEPYAGDTFITPMAAVAGSVADAVLAAMVAAEPGRLDRAYVNNGGDIAIHLSPGTKFVTGLVTRPDDPSLFATAEIRFDDGVGGIATSGAPGRSFSLGIADAVTILAKDGATADAAATIVANAVDLPGDPRVLRMPANTIEDDSELGARLVTRGVALLPAADRGRALQRGVDTATRLFDAGQIAAAALYLQGEARFVGSSRLIDPNGLIHIEPPPVL